MYSSHDSRTAEALLNQVGVNTTTLSDLQDKLQQRVGRHVDVREALMSKKDEQLEGKLENNVHTLSTSD